MASSSHAKTDTKAESLTKESLTQLKAELEKIETTLLEKSKKIEKEFLLTLPEDPPAIKPSSNLILNLIQRIHIALRRYMQAEELTLKDNENLQKELKNYQLNFEEIQMERDVLLERVHNYLETNSSLRVRLEEQRCQTATLQSQLNGDMESPMQILEQDNKKLKTLIVEKEKEIEEVNTMLDQTMVGLKIKEDEMASLKKELEKTLREKVELEEKYRKIKDGDSVKRYKRSAMRRSRSMGDVRSESVSLWNVDEEDDVTGYSEKSCKLTVAESLAVKKDSSSDCFFECFSNVEEQSQLSVSESSSTNTGTSWKSVEDAEGPALHEQLNALKYGLVNITQKLKVLKSQLINTDSQEQMPRSPSSHRSLKRKAEPLDGAQESKEECKSLKDILEDAKMLNAKLQTLREEKQKVIDSNRKENVEVQVKTKMNEKFSQTTAEEDSIGLRFPTALKVLKSAVTDCEGKLEDEETRSKDEALADLVSAFSSCIFGNSRRSDESEKRAVGSEIDPESLKEDDAKSNRENGGGDNLLKKEISGEGKGSKELRTQIARLKFEIERYPNRAE